MKKLTVEQVEANFDAIMDRVESGESFIISNEHGDVIMTPANVIEEVDDLVRIYRDHNEGS